MQIAIVVYKGMTALDAIGPYEVLRQIPHAEIRFVSNKVEPIVTDSGVLVLGATHSFDETPKPDLVLVPGSSADTTTAMANGRLLKWLQDSYEGATRVTSVCSGALVLAAAGLLEGRPATTHWVAQAMLGQFGAEARPEERIVRSGKIVTAAGVSAGIDLALELVIELCDRRQAESIQLLIEYDPQPPVDTGHPSKAPEDLLQAARAEMLRQARNPRDLISVPTVLWRTALGKLRRRLGFQS